MPSGLHIRHGNGNLASGTRRDPDEDGCRQNAEDEKRFHAQASLKIGVSMRRADDLHRLGRDGMSRPDSMNKCLLSVSGVLPVATTQGHESRHA